MVHLLPSDQSEQIEEVATLLYKSVSGLANVLVPFFNL